MKAGRPWRLLGLRLRGLPFIGGTVAAVWPNPRAQNLLVLGTGTAAWGLLVTTWAGGLKVCAWRLQVTGNFKVGWLEAVLRTDTETRRDELGFHSIAAVKIQVCLKQHSCIKNAMLSKTDVSQTHNA